MSQYLYRCTICICADSGLSICTDTNSSDGDFLRPGEGSESSPIVEEFRETCLPTCDFMVLSIDSETIYSHLSPRLLAALRGRRRRLMLILTLEQRLGPTMTRCRVEGVIGFLGYCEAVQSVEIGLVMDEDTAEEPTYDQLPVGAWLAERVMANFPNCQVLGFKPFLMRHSELVELLSHPLVVGRIRHLDIQTALLTGRERVVPFAWVEPALGLTSLHATNLGPLPISLRDRTSNLVTVSVTEMYLADVGNLPRSVLTLLIADLNATDMMRLPERMHPNRFPKLLWALLFLVIQFAEVIFKEGTFDDEGNMTEVGKRVGTDFGTDQRLQMSVTSSDKGKLSDSAKIVGLTSPWAYSQWETMKQEAGDKAELLTRRLHMAVEVATLYLSKLMPFIQKVAGGAIRGGTIIGNDPMHMRKVVYYGKADKFSYHKHPAHRTVEAQVAHVDVAPNTLNDDAALKAELARPSMILRPSSVTAFYLLLCEDSVKWLLVTEAHAEALWGEHTTDAQKAAYAAALKDMPKLSIRRVKPGATTYVHSLSKEFCMNVMPTVQPRHGWPLVREFDNYRNVMVPLPPYTPPKQPEYDLHYRPEWDRQLPTHHIEGLKQAVN
ncbi:hypothetical protein QJQ45_004714 [Haematococcus lacustris]|nr:hypothetical protein QJQ45_004714 [Haematococcus lacustris]